MPVICWSDGPNFRTSTKNQSSAQFLPAFLPGLCWDASTCPLTLFKASPWPPVPWNLLFGAELRSWPLELLRRLASLAADWLLWHTFKPPNFKLSLNFVSHRHLTSFKKCDSFSHQSDPPPFAKVRTGCSLLQLTELQTVRVWIASSKFIPVIFSLTIEPINQLLDAAFEAVSFALPRSTAIQLVS